MKIHDAALFSIVLPTFEGTPYLRRTLDYFGHVGFRGRIVLSDNSSGEHRTFVASCADKYPGLRIEAHLYPENVRFLDKMVDTLRKTESRFVMLHAQDDFLVPAAVERCVDFLDNRPDYSVALGRVAMFVLAHEGEGPVKKLALSLGHHPMRAFEQDSPLERVFDHLERYASTLYAVHRRECLSEAFRLTEQYTRNVMFFQYLSSCISALKGKVWCSEELFYLRQRHDDSWSGRLRQGDYESWPMLITSPHLSRYYGEFRDALCELLADSGVPAEELGARIDRASVSLFKRSFCGTESDNPGNARFMDRMNDTASEENRLLMSVGQFATRYPDTI